MQRNDGRRNDELRSLRITYNPYEYAAGSILYELGKTKVLCAVTLQSGVPPFLRGTRTGWLTAHYAMLPTSTVKRTEREIQLGKPNSRYVEISRLIGRSLRSVMNLETLQERTIIIDCDILQADGGTRTACITAAYLALCKAEQKWRAMGIIEQPLFKHALAAISVGVCNGELLLDPNCEEDSSSDGDFNFILTSAGDVVEIQGTAEKKPLSQTMLSAMYALAYKGTQDIFSCLASNKEPQESKKQGLFTLSQRLGKQLQRSPEL